MACRTAATMPGARRVLLARRAHHRARRLDQALERTRPALQMDQDRRPDHRPHLPLLLTHLRTGTLGDDDLAREINAEDRGAATIFDQRERLLLPCPGPGSRRERRSSLPRAGTSMPSIVSRAVSWAG